MFQKRKKQFIVLGLSILFSVVLLHCGNTNTTIIQSKNNNSLEISGRWQDNFNSSYIITDNLWSQYSNRSSGEFPLGYLIYSFSNKNNFLVYENLVNVTNSSRAGFNNSLIVPTISASKIQWIEESNNVTYYCIVGFGMRSIVNAIAFENTNINNNTSNGCNSFPWTRLTRIQQ